MVDNCYCEFVTEKEPIEVGADIAVGSLIKNLGAGIAPNGAYVVGKGELINLIAERLTAPGEGKEVGPTLGVNKQFLEGLFLAPSVVASSLKTAVLTSKIMEELGYKTEPMYNCPAFRIESFGAAKVLRALLERIIHGRKEKTTVFVSVVSDGKPNSRWKA